MRVLKVFFISWLVVYVSGCEKYVVSLEPLCSEKTCITDARLTGKWDGDDEVWTIRQGEDNSYDVRLVDILNIGRFKGRTCRIGDALFLELVPEALPEGMRAPGYFSAHLVKAYSFMKVQFNGESLTWIRMDAGKLKERLTQKPDLIEHVIQDDNVIIRDSSQAVARFVQAQADVNDLWKKHATLQRCKPLYTKDDLVHEDVWAGRWADPNGTLEIRDQDGLYGLSFTPKDEETLQLSMHVFRIQDMTFMGIFLGQNEEEVAREMATCMPDWFALVSLNKDRMALTILSYTKLKAMLDDPVKAKEARSKPDVQLTRQRNKR
jgi:hypothetical protein